MILNNRTEFINYFDNLLIENGVRDICKRCNEGEFFDENGLKGCCTDCEYLGKNGCVNPNIRCILASCRIIEDLKPDINWYLGYIQSKLNVYVYWSRRDGRIKFPVTIPKFNSKIRWKERFFRISKSSTFSNRY